MKMWFHLAGVSWVRGRILDAAAVEAMGSPEQGGHRRAR